MDETTMGSTRGVGLANYIREFDRRAENLPPTNDFGIQKSFCRAEEGTATFHILKRRKAQDASLVLSLYMTLTHTLKISSDRKE